MSIFDKYVDEIAKAPVHLTEENLTRLRAAILTDEELVALEEAEHVDEKGGLGGLLGKLTQMSNTLYNKALRSKDADDMKAAAEGIKRALDMSLKYAEKINASDRAIKVEGVLVDTLTRFCDERGLEELKMEFCDQLKEVIDEQ